jgi:lipopolysaccharide transport system permease protein
MKKEKTKIYCPDRERVLGIGAIVWEMFQELLESRELVWRLFKRDFLAKYRQSLLGVTWAFIIPIVTVGLFVFLKSAGVMQMQESAVPYPLYSLVGLTIWQIFASGVLLSSQSLIGAGDLISKINLPMVAIVSASFLETLVEFLIRSLLVLLLFVYYGIFPSNGIIFFPLTLIPIYLLMMGVGLLFSIMNVILRDVGKITTYFILLLMFATPVLYPIPETAQWFFLWNPFTYLVNAPRDLLFEGNLTHSAAYIATTLFSVLFFMVSWVFFHIVEKRVPERI